MSTDWPELELATDWQEIERAMGELVSTGVDPTYERAKDWLRDEKRRNACKHNNIELFDVDQQSDGVTICLDCGAARRRPEHPYGTSPEGLINEVRVEMEKIYRETGNGWMPPADKRFRDAEIVARKRWPEHFDDAIDR
jgi:hypothetical protein